MKHETEAVYDEQMAPLVDKLIEIAREHGIPMLFHAGMIMDDGGAGGCITLVPGEEHADLDGINNRHKLCAEICRGDARFDRAKALMITKFH